MLAVDEGKPRTMQLPSAQAVDRVLVVIAHPDDAEFWIGGTVALWTSAGIEVSYLVLTDGDAGGFDPSLPRPDVPAIRRAEQQHAAEVLGVRDVRFLGLPEGGLPDAGRDLHIELVRAIRRVRPERVITWSPEWNWARFRSCHPDHLATGAAALRAIYPDAGNPFALTQLIEQEGLEPWTVPEIWLINSPAERLNRFVDVTDVFDRKVSAVLAHASQVSDAAGLPRFLRERDAGNTAPARLPAGRLVEAFQVVQSG